MLLNQHPGVRSLCAIMLAVTAVQDQGPDNTDSIGAPRGFQPMYSSHIHVPSALQHISSCIAWVGMAQGSKAQHSRAQSSLPMSPCRSHRKTCLP